MNTKYIDSNFPIIITACGGKISSYEFYKNLEYEKYKYELFKNIDEAKKKYLDDHDNYKESK